MPVSNGTSIGADLFELIFDECKWNCNCTFHKTL